MMQTEHAKAEALGALTLVAPKSWRRRIALPRSLLTSFRPIPTSSTGVCMLKI